MPPSAKPETLKMGGAQSKDTDQTLTRMIDKTANVKFIYMPFKSGAEAAVQLAGGHIDSHINNPNENIGHWKAGTSPLCVQPAAVAVGPKVQARGWADIPTCKDGGLTSTDSRYRGPCGSRRSPAGSGRLLRGSHEEGQRNARVEGICPESTSQTGRFVTGEEFKEFMQDDIKHITSVRRGGLGRQLVMISSEGCRVGKARTKGRLQSRSIVRAVPTRAVPTPCAADKGVAT